MIKSEIKVAAVLFGAALCGFAGAEEVDSVLAAVNGDPVTLAEILPAVRDREFQLRNAFSGKKLENEVLKVRCKAVEEILTKLRECTFADEIVSVEIQSRFDIKVKITQTNAVEDSIASFNISKLKIAATKLTAK